MEKQTFEHEMAKAKTFHDLGEKTDYYRGYMRGLRRKFHGEKFGTDAEHEKWMSLITDPCRAETGQGYRDGFNHE